MQAQRDAWTARLDTLEALLRAEDEAEAARKKVHKKAGSSKEGYPPKAKGKRK